MLFFLKGCCSVGGLFLKKCLSLLLLSKLSRGSDSCVCDWTRLGTKVKPRERTSFCGDVSVLDERLVIYLSLFSSFCISLLVCLRTAFLVFLFMNLGSFSLFSITRSFSKIEFSETLFFNN